MERPGRGSDLGDLLRRPTRHHHAVDHRILRLAARRLPRLGHSPRRPRPPQPEPSGWCAATRWRCCRSWATTSGTISSTGSISSARTESSKLPKIFYVNWFRRRRPRRVPVARLRRKLTDPQVGTRTRRGNRRVRGDPDRSRSDPRCPGSDRTRIHRPTIAAALKVDPAEWAAELPSSISGTPRSAATDSPTRCVKSCVPCVNDCRRSITNSPTRPRPATRISGVCAPAPTDC